MSLYLYTHIIDIKLPNLYLKSVFCIHPPGTAELKESKQNPLREMKLPFFTPEIQNSKSLFHRQILTA